MDGGPWTDLGTLGWFLGVWVVMMAAMMFPSVAPTVALYSRMTRSRSPLRRSLFTAGYLLAWTGVGRPRLRGRGGRRPRLSGDVLAWDRAGPLGGRRDPHRRRRLRAHAAQGRLPRQVPQPARLPARLLARRTAGALQMGARHGAWCIGCCWALMASLFALGVMSIVWMAFVAGLIAFEKLIPRVGRRPMERRASCSCSACSCSPRRHDPGAHDPGERLDVADEPDEPLTGPRFAWARRSASFGFSRSEACAERGRLPRLHET